MSEGTEKTTRLRQICRFPIQDIMLNLKTRWWEKKITVGNSWRKIMVLCERKLVSSPCLPPSLPCRVWSRDKWKCCVDGKKWLSGVEGRPQWSQRVPMADSGHLLQSTKGDEGERKLIFLLSPAKNLNVYVQLGKMAKGRSSLCWQNTQDTKGLKWRKWTLEQGSDPCLSSNIWNWLSQKKYLNDTLLFEI